MHITRLAPELSATSNTVCIWIIEVFLSVLPASSNRLTLFQRLDDPPALLLGHRSCLGDPNAIANATDIGFVVGFVVDVLGQILPIARVLDSSLDANDD